jgi:hypothetical protein
MLADRKIADIVWIASAIQQNASDQKAGENEKQIYTQPSVSQINIKAFASAPVPDPIRRLE